MPCTCPKGAPRRRPAGVVLNLPELLLRVENDRDLLRELIEIFKEESPRLLQQLREHVVRKDMKSVEETSHGLKGMLSGLSAMPAASVAARLERMGREGDMAGLSDAVTLLELEIEKLLPELDASITEAES
jgi:HPt (histidine-containing phosphotransfer) domain-containing protein